VIPGRPVSWVFDRSALACYARRQSLVVPSLVAVALDSERCVAVSALALAEGYRRLSDDRADLLDLLIGGPLGSAFLVESLDGDAARVLGRRGGDGAELRLDTLHTVALAERHWAGVVTDDASTVQGLLGDDWPTLAP
jgi:hypothetical protein